MRQSNYEPKGAKAIITKAKAKQCDEAIAREIIDDIWPYAVTIPDVMWNARQHILDTELGPVEETNDS